MTANRSFSPTLSTLDWTARTSILVCPRCGFDHMHQGEVVVYDRKEDANTVVRTTVSEGGVAVDPRSSLEGNPSERRHGVTIAFDCEGCGPGILLNIGQHKGQTEIGWTMTTGNG